MLAWAIALLFGFVVLFFVCAYVTLKLVLIASRLEKEYRHGKD